MLRERLSTLASSGDRRGDLTGTPHHAGNVRGALRSLRLSALRGVERSNLGLRLSLTIRAGATGPQALAEARESGLELTSDLDLAAADKVVRWKEYGLDYTFLVFSLQKSS